MPDSPNKLSQFWKELKRRKVTRVISIYAAAAFVILELTDIVAPSLRLPGWTLNFVIILIALGFILVTILSWIYDIDPEGGIVRTEPANQVKTDEVQVSSNSWKIATYISFMVIAALIVLNILPRSGRSTGEISLDKSIAVLPFINDSPNEEKMYFINGTMEAILNNLCKIEDLRVVSRTSVEQYRNNPKPLSEISKEMNVSYILEGSGQKVGNRVLLTIQLLDGIHDQHLWSRRYDREIRKVQDLIDIQSEVAQLVASEIQVIITPEEKQLIEKTPTTSLTAYDLYQRGREEHFKYWNSINNKEALQVAEDFYFEALEYDSTFALAYTGLAWVYRNKNYWKEIFSDSFLDSGLVLTNIALSYDEQLADAYLFKGRYYRATGHTEQALKAYDKAIRYNPNDYMGYYYKGVACCNEDIIKCIENIEQSASIDRGILAAYFTVLGMIYRNVGFPEKARDYWQAALKLNGDSAAYYLLLSDIEIYQNNHIRAVEFYNRAMAIDSTKSYVDLIGYVLYGKFDVSASFLLFDREEALAYAEKYLERVSVHGEFGLANMHRVGYANGINGNQEEADSYFEMQLEFCNKQNQLGRVWSEQLFTYYDMAAIAASRGETELAYKHLRTFNQRKIMHMWMVWNIKNDPLFDGIRHQSDFQQIVSDMEAKYQAEHERVQKWMEENER
jgi:TolB-like protein